MKSSRKLGLALGGGAILGAVHIGVLKAIESHNIEVSCISGTSIGSLIAALYAFGHRASDIENIISDIGWLDISRLALSKKGLLSNQRLGKLIRKHVGNKTIDQADIPLAIVASELIKGEKIVLKDTDVTSSVMASTCIPGIFTPIEIDDMVLVNGGILENVPISPLKEFGCQKIISVDLTNIKGVAPNNIFDVLLNTLNIAQKNASKLQQIDADIIIAPDLSDYNMFDRKQVPSLIKEGYKCAMDALKDC